MCYMENKMDEFMEQGQAKADAIFELMAHFEDFYLLIPNIDKSLIKENDGYFDYCDDNVQLMWICFRRGAGLSIGE